MKNCGQPGGQPQPQPTQPPQPQPTQAPSTSAPLTSKRYYFLSVLFQQNE